MRQKQGNVIKDFLRSHMSNKRNTWRCETKHRSAIRSRPRSRRLTSTQSAMDVSINHRPELTSLRTLDRSVKMSSAADFWDWYMNASKTRYTSITQCLKKMLEEWHEEKCFFRMARTTKPARNIRIAATHKITLKRVREPLVERPRLYTRT